MLPGTPVPENSSHEPKPAVDPGSVVKETEIPTPGARWKGAYQIEEALVREHRTPAWRGIHIISMDPVLVRIARNNDSSRENTWARLAQIKRDDMQKPREAHIVGKHRFEVWDLGPKLTLREWRASLKCVGTDALHAIIRSAADLLGELHGCGIGHFNLSPDTVFVDESEDKVRLVVGGWETATLFSQAEPITLPVDPFYAPPEAAGQAQHAPGEMLAAWDWWSLGRLVQELVLGSHVLGVVLNRDVSQAAPENKAQAEAMLLQRAAGGHKAGAVEAMPELDKRLELLLRGLLAANREARWHRAEVLCWLNGASPREHYTLSTREHCLRFMEEAFTAPELIEALQTEALWDQGAAQILDGDMPGTLAAFVHEHLASTLGSKFDAALSLLADESLQEFPPEALREAVQAAALNAMAGGRMILRGKHVAAESLAEYLLREDGSGRWLASIWALASSKVVHLLDKTDRDAARILGDLGKLADKALAKGWENEWLRRNDLLGIARMWQLACEPAPVLQKKCEALHREYACSTRPEVDLVFQPLRPSPEDLVLLAFMDSDCGRFGFITHVEFARRKYEDFRKQGAQMRRVIFWKRLYEALDAGPWLFGRLRWLLAGWLGLALLASIARPGPAMSAIAFVPLLVAVGTRIAVSIRLRQAIALEFGTEKPWRLFDGPKRCLSEIAGHSSAHRHASELMVQLDDINREIAALTVLKPAPPPVAAPPRFATIAMMSIASWTAMAALVLGCFWQMKKNPPSWHRIKQAWSANASASSGSEEESYEPAREVKIPWPFRAPSDVKLIEPHEIVDATDAQIREARRAGRSLAVGYESGTISTPILVRVTTEEHFGFMFYDGKNDRVSGRKVFLLLYNPMPRSWLQIEGRRAYVPGD
ncbi:MAG: hypothetical protein WC378_02360 [Opitutaceae bacterium]|jgi:hypothetical protein